MNSPVSRPPAGGASVVIPVCNLVTYLRNEIHAINTLMSISNPAYNDALLRLILLADFIDLINDSLRTSPVEHPSPESAE